MGFRASGVHAFRVFRVKVQGSTDLYRFVELGFMAAGQPRNIGFRTKQLDCKMKDLGMALNFGNVD